jgi:1-acyl-sn-glycerol-3-phosphate acyltransferase
MNEALLRLRSLLIWIFVFPIFIVGISAIFLTALVYRGPRLESLIKAVSRIILFSVGIRLQTRGRENFDPASRYIVVMNHVNFFDPFVFFAAFPGPARGMEEEKHFRWPLYGAMLRRIGMVPVDRGHRLRARESLKRAAGLIRARPGFSFTVMAEGTRTRDGKLGPFKRGAFILAAEAGLDILPMAQIGAGRINRKGSRLIRPGQIDIVIGPPISPDGATRENHEEFLERTRAWFLRYVD